MRLGWFKGASVMVATTLLSVVAAAQSGQGPLQLPYNVQFVGPQQPGIRKATAIVNGEIITETDVDQRLALIVASNRVTLPPEELQRVRAQVLRNLIDETLQIQEATRQEITVEDREVDDYYNRFSRNFNQSPAGFTAYLRSVGASDRSLKRQIRGELAWQRLQRRVVEPFVTVGDDEVRVILERIQASQGQTEYRVAEIFVSATPETQTAAQTNAARLVQQIRGGASFGAYARQFSEASTAAVGGDLGWVRAEQLPDEIATVVREMPVGAISDPIPVPGGFSVVALADARRLGLPDPRDARLSLMQMSIVLPAGTTSQQAQARASQLQERSQNMGGCGGAAAAAQAIGAELVNNDQVRVRDLPAPLQQPLLALSVGQATAPFGSQERVSILIVCGRDEPPPVAAPNPEAIQNSLLEQRVGMRAQRFLRDLRRDAVIDYR
ncbi:peptidylprolyl isomerase [Sphingosinicella sp.]|uniref:peptidylprolyl isomerase n=1 Tax=Sphingosinicella sp. TaxID=1917971 RepID=UPI004037F4DF